MLDHADSLVGRSSTGPVADTRRPAGAGRLETTGGGSMIGRFAPGGNNTRAARKPATGAAANDHQRRVGRAAGGWGRAFAGWVPIGRRGGGYLLTSRVFGAP